jgi:hypothetical protein
MFLLRRLPLAPGFKTTLKTQPFTLASKVKSPVEFVVTGIETVQTVAGKFNCYKVAMRAIGQTFWIGMEGARPLVKFQAGNVEAELVKVWTTNTMDSVYAFAIAAGWRTPTDSNVYYRPIGMGPGPEGGATVVNPDDHSEQVGLNVRNVYTPKAEIAQALQKTMADSAKEFSTERVRPESVETLEIGGQQALRCVRDFKSSDGSNPSTAYYVWIRTESTAVEFRASFSVWSFPVFRWKFDQMLTTVKVP